VAGIRSTGIFCRPGCPARRPREDRVDFFAGSHAALAAGYRPCRRCHPLEPAGASPGWLRPLLDAVEADPARPWREADLRALGLQPGRVRRWFRAHHGMTFGAYVRTRRLSSALASLRGGSAIVDVGLDHGWESLSGFREAFGRLVGEPPGRGRERLPVHVARILTPLGPMVAAATDEGICLLEFADRPALPLQLRRLARFVGGVPAPGAHPHLAALESELATYFGSGRPAFTTPLVLAGTAFQEAAWRWLLTIPAGETRTYADGARAIGRPAAARAFAGAVGDNRLAILVPCHRVVGTTGRLTGYAGGLWRKQRLLELEGSPAG
jgi:AraC family transcriptional regulator of adaptative response/methylated-DNA-[protein]-cysteine methyltransferase